MLTALILAVGVIVLIPLICVVAYRMGLREGREQGLSESYKLYGGMRRTVENAAPQEPEKSAAV